MQFLDLLNVAFISNLYPSTLPNVQNVKRKVSVFLAFITHESAFVDFLAMLKVINVCNVAYLLLPVNS